MSGKPWRNVCERCKQPTETMALYAGQYLCPACVVLEKDLDSIEHGAEVNRGTIHQQVAEGPSHIRRDGEGGEGEC